MSEVPRFPTEKRLGRGLPVAMFSAAAEAAHFRGKTSAIFYVVNNLFFCVVYDVTAGARCLSEALFRSAFRSAGLTLLRLIDLSKSFQIYVATSGGPS